MISSELTETDISILLALLFRLRCELINKGDRYILVANFYIKVKLGQNYLP